MKQALEGPPDQPAGDGDEKPRPVEDRLRVEPSKLTPAEPLRRSDVQAPPQRDSFWDDIARRSPTLPTAEQDDERT